MRAISLDATCARISFMAHGGVPEREIARTLGLSHGAVARRIRFMRKAGYDVPAAGRCDFLGAPSIPLGFVLTPRQAEIAAAYAAGLDRSQVARKLGICPDIVTNHMTHLRSAIAAVSA